MTYVGSAELQNGFTAPSTQDPDHLLRVARDERIYANEIELASLISTIRWLTAVNVGDVENAWIREVPVAGDGAPDVREDHVGEFAAEMGMTIASARHYLADAWDLNFRLPHTFVAMKSLDIPVWKARQIASATHGLSREATLYVDKIVGPKAAKIGPTKLRSIVLAAEVRFAPEAAAARETASRETRGVETYPDLAGSGTSSLFGHLDDADAADLMTAVTQAAQDLKDAGNDETLVVRRSQALGHIARTYLAGNKNSDEPTRLVNIYVHTKPGDEFATVEGSDHLRTLDHIREWCTASRTKVIVRPVIDLNDDLSRKGYVPSETMREQAALADITCVAPHCTASARTGDLDHIIPWPRGSTSSQNLGSLCRYHHRLKTHAGWTYTKLEPGYYLWRTPAGRHYLRTPAGTIKLD